MKQMCCIPSPKSFFHMLHLTKTRKIALMRVLNFFACLPCLPQIHLEYKTRSDLVCWIWDDFACICTNNRLLCGSCRLFLLSHSTNCLLLMLQTFILVKHSLFLDRFVGDLSSILSSTYSLFVTIYASILAFNFVVGLVIYEATIDRLSVVFSYGWIFWELCLTLTKQITQNML